MTLRKMVSESKKPLRKSKKVSKRSKSDKELFLENKELKKEIRLLEENKKLKKQLKSLTMEEASEVENGTSKLTTILKDELLSVDDIFDVLTNEDDINLYDFDFEDEEIKDMAGDIYSGYGLETVDDVVIEDSNQYYANMLLKDDIDPNMIGVNYIEIDNDEYTDEPTIFVTYYSVIPFEYIEGNFYDEEAKEVYDEYHENEDIAISTQVNYVVDKYNKTFNPDIFSVTDIRNYPTTITQKYYGENYA